MLKTIWQKIKQNHLLMMVVCCVVPIVLVIGLFSLFKVGNYWIWLIILLCPLMHFFMMKGHGHKKELYKCPECGFEYKEKQWAEKCEAWCKKYQSCNLEITNHAIKRSNKD